MSREDSISEFGELWALLYLAMAREMVEAFGPEGLQALRRAVRRYGELRGRRLRERHEAQGLPINIRSLFEHYDLPSHPEMVRRRAILTDDRLDSTVLHCPYREVWRRYGGEHLGLIYCEEFHRAMWRAYRDDIVVEQPEIMTRGDPRCRFIVYIQGRGEDE
ncbi:hypothetical protein CW701_02170 [Candidatus Bathyarchaeota archaeon]|nr:MAG: hypothetical protein CW701_02170 [Candidatus Bathyarchaeota archaeon]